MGLAYQPAHCWNRCWDTLWNEPGTDSMSYWEYIKYIKKSEGIFVSSRSSFFMVSSKTKCKSLLVLCSGFACLASFFSSFYSFWIFLGMGVYLWIKPLSCWCMATVFLNASSSFSLKLWFSLLMFAVVCMQYSLPMGDGNHNRTSDVAESFQGTSESRKACKKCQTTSRCVHSTLVALTSVFFFNACHFFPFRKIPLCLTELLPKSSWSLVAILLPPGRQSLLGGFYNDRFGRGRDPDIIISPSGPWHSGRFSGMTISQRRKEIGACCGTPEGIAKRVQKII